MPCLQRIVSIPSSGGNSCSTFSFSDFGYHLGHPLPSILLPVFSRLASKTLSFDPVIFAVPPIDTDGFVFSTMSSLRGNLSRHEFNVDMEQGPLLVVLKIVESLLSPFPSPPDRPGSRDEIPCWWCCIVTTQFLQKLKILFSV